MPESEINPLKMGYLLWLSHVVHIAEKHDFLSGPNATLRAQFDLKPSGQYQYDADEMVPYEFVPAGQTGQKLQPK